MSIHQPAVPAHRYAVGRAPQGKSRAGGPISPYLYALHRIEPRGGGHVQSPEQYRWSSYRWHAWGEPNPLVNDHDLYVGLGTSAHDRQCAYRNLFRSQIREIDIHPRISRLHHPLGNDRFREQVETTLGKRVGRRQRGRPPKHVDAPR